MAVDTQLEFNTSYFFDAKVTCNTQPQFSVGDTKEVTFNFYLASPFSLGYIFQLDTCPSGFQETITGYLDSCVLNSIALIPIIGITYQDYLSSCVRFFGENFKQDANKIYINKSDLPSFIPKPENTAESLFIALLLRVLMYESNDLVSLVNVYNWRTSFVEVDGVPKRLQVFVAEINVPAKYRYINTEIINANDSLTPDEL